jgi:hypothetical protein
MSKPNFEKVGSLWRKRNGNQEHLFGKMKQGNVIFNVWAHPNKGKTNQEDPDFYLLIDEGEIDQSDPFWGYEYLFANI